MQKIIDRTEQIAMEYLTGLGFGEEQVQPLIDQARRDMETEFARLDVLCSTEPADPVALDRSLHAIKGLLFNLGNHELAEKLEAIRTGENGNRMVEAIERVLEEERNR